MTLRPRLSALAFTAAIVLASVPALAGWETHRGVGMKFNVPDSWVTSTEGSVLVSHPPSNDPNPAVALEFVAVEHGTSEAKKVEESLMAKLGQKFTDVKVTSKTKKVKQHGLDGIVFSGTAKTKEGKDIRWASIAFDSRTDSNKGLIVMAVGTPAAFKAHSTEVTTTLDSIQSS